VLADFREFGAGPNDTYNFQTVLDSALQIQRKAGWLPGAFDFTENVSGFFEASFIRTDSEYQQAPAPLFSQFENPNIVVAANQAFNPFGEEITDARRRLNEVGNRKFNFETENARFAGGHARHRV
jgi:hypothetical protein